MLSETNRLKISAEPSYMPFGHHSAKSDVKCAGQTKNGSEVEIRFTFDIN